MKSCPYRCWSDWDILTFACAYAPEVVTVPSVWANILPSLRDLRTPLITGYLWFAAIWVALTHWSSAPDLDRPFSEHIEEVLSVGGHAAHLAALSFAAYILGGLVSTRSIGPGSRDDSVGTRSGFFKRFLVVLNPPVSITRYAKKTARKEGDSSILRRWSNDQVRRMALTEDVKAAIEVDRQLPDRLRIELLRTIDQRADASSREALAAAIAIWIEREELSSLRVRLRLEQESLFQDHDRLVSESELRCSIYLPLLVLGIEAAMLQSPWYLIGAVLIPGMLLMDGLNLDKQSREIIYDALAAGAISSPTMDRIQQLASPAAPTIASLPTPTSAGAGAALGQGATA